MTGGIGEQHVSYVMEIRLPQAVAALAVLAIAISLWVGSSVGGEPGAAAGASGLSEASDTSVLTNRNEGSAVPCAFPLAWRIVRVDPRFELSTGEVRQAFSEAASLWEQSVGRRLFVHDPESGFPVRLVYDERQARTRELRAGEAELTRASDDIEAREREIAEMRRRHEEARRQYQARVESLRERVSAHNDSVRTWNARGGAPEPVARRARATEEALRREELELDARLEELEQERTEIERASRDLRSRARSLNRRITDLEEDIPTTPVEAGLYRESVAWRGDRVTSVEREIRIYRFDDRDGLRRIAAHELGHAMGLGHVQRAGALMSERYARAGGVEDVVAVTSADLDLLATRCPESAG